MAMILDHLHSFRILFIVSISRSHLYKLGPIVLRCATNISSIPATLLFFSAAIPFLHASSLKGYIIEVSPSADVGSTGLLGLFMAPRPLVSNCSNCV